MAESAG